ncbi:glycoside hydrolase family 3 protein [Planosporangium mesophilum]|uniref:glycoside hydrolase family 3 protein n=1 Tax=Planosporangium mesophilum TaxID=689768 RepID=UPI0027E4A3B7|nr:glycoside hydrolase family 3 C-terminal domain-containing protein [Planosporangium mesophilum]
MRRDSRVSRHNRASRGRRDGSARRRIRRGIAAGLVTLLAATLAPGPAMAAPDGYAYPFQNPRLPLAARVDDLVSRLTLDEKISLLHQYQPAIPRLGIRLFKAGTEALHGVAWSNDHTDNGSVVTATATVFPQAVGLASTWDPALIQRVGSAVGDEARGLNAQNPTVWGLNLWAPVVNLLRDPRWGRNEEGYSEDPYLTGAISTAYGHGLEGNDPRYLKTAPTLKHYLAYNNEVRRDTTSSVVPPRVLNEYDRAAFEPAIAADAATGVMPSYNLVNGRPNTVSPELNDVVRSWTDKPLFNPSDAGAPANLTGSEHYFATQAEANAAAIKAGINSFTQDGTDPTGTVNAIRSALAQGLLSESDIDTAVGQNLSLRFRLGEFDPDGGPYAKITPTVVNSPAHQRLARQAADEAAVLLKNTGRTLPLDASKTKKVAVVGPLSDVLYTDWYSGALPYRVTPLAGVKERLGAGATVTGSEGADRITLKDVATGQYVTGGTGPGGAALAERATGPDPTTQFDVFDWGQGVLTLRSVANGRYVGYNWSAFVNDQTQPNGWFVQQMFKLEQRADGNYAIRYAGYESAYDWSQAYRTPYLTRQPDGTLNLGAATADAATAFTKDVVTSGRDSAVAAAKGADAAVVVVGSMPFINGREDHDRTDMGLAEGQEALVRAVREANPNTIVVVSNSYPTTLNWEQEHVPAILWTTHAGQETGHAVADVLFGDHNPAGRLTQTWYRSTADLPDILDYDIIAGDRTYQYFRGTPLYPMGYGLSYTTFRYDNLRVTSPVVDSRGAIRVSVDVTNTGSRAGDEVVQLYSHAQRSRVKQPIKQLRGFNRVHLNPGQRRTVTITIKASDLAFWDVTRSRYVVESGGYDLMVGASSADIRATGQVRVRGEVIPPRDLTRTTRAENFDDYSGVTLVDESKVRGTSVGSTGAGTWLKFADSSLERGTNRLTVRASNAGTAEIAVRVRLDDPVSGPLLGTARVPVTGDVYSYTDVTAALQRATGRHDVYLVFDGPARLSTFSLS